MIRKQQEHKVPWEEYQEVAVENVQNEELYDMLSVLDEKYRVPMMLYYGQGYKTEEIANMLHSTKSTIQTRLARGREKLATYYKERRHSMKAYKEIFQQNIELPDVVLQKMDDAFAMIQAEDKETMVEVREISHAKSKRRIFKGQMAAVACVSVLVVGSITAVAAIHHYWSRGMQGTLQATEEQRHELVEQGMAEVLTDRKHMKS